MGVLPLQFMNGQDAESLGLTGEEVYEIAGLAPIIEKFPPQRVVQVHARRPDGKDISFQAQVRIDTPQEALYYKHGGILQYVLRQLAAKSK